MVNKDEYIKLQSLEHRRPKTIR